jgi:hypothetical protein
LPKAKSEKEYRLSNFSRAWRRRVAIVENDVRRIPVRSQGRVATVVCRLENKKPKEIVRFYCQRFKVKSDGSIDQAHNQKRSVPAATLDRALVRNTINREKTGDPIDPTHGRRLAHSLVMISRAAQKKINEVLWR